MSLEEDALLLAKVELFANVAPRRLKLLALASSRVLFAAGQDLCVEGDEGYEAFILVSGEADVKIKTPTGVATVARLKRNDIVGEMAKAAMKIEITTQMPPNTTCATRPIPLSRYASAARTSARSMPNGSIDGPTIETQIAW